MKLVFATHNPGKVREMRALLAGLPIEVLSATEAGVHEEAAETGATFEENAEIKARHTLFFHDRLKEDYWAFADDSGFSIDALGGRPGVHSARWAGEGATDEAIVAHTLSELGRMGTDDRRACHQTSLVLLAPDGRRWAAYGETRGRIAIAAAGTPRPKLPYDVIFIPEGFDRTYAELDDAVKNGLSSRAKAFSKLRDTLISVLPIDRVE